MISRKIFKKLRGGKLMKLPHCEWLARRKIRESNELGYWLEGSLEEKLRKSTNSNGMANRKIS